MLSFLLHWFVPTALANQLTGGNTGTQAMWNQICIVMQLCSAQFGARGEGVVVAMACRIVVVVFQVISGAAACLLIYAGIKMITSRGNDEAVTEAKTIVLYALGGMLLSLIAIAFVPFAISVIQQVFGEVPWGIPSVTCGEV